MEWWASTPRGPAHATPRLSSWLFVFRSCRISASSGPGGSLSANLIGMPVDVVMWFILCVICIEYSVTSVTLANDNDWGFFSGYRVVMFSSFPSVCLILVNIPQRSLNWAQISTKHQDKLTRFWWTKVKVSVTSCHPIFVLRDYFQNWHKRPLKLKVGLIRIWRLTVKVTFSVLFPKCL